MAGDGDVQLTPDQLRQTAEDTHAVADRIDRILATLKNARPGGAPWGKDSYGDEFASDQGGKPGYVTSADNLVDGGAKIVSTIRSYADGMAKTAANADADEQSAANQFTAPDLGSNAPLANEPTVPQAHPGWTVR